MRSKSRFALPLLAGMMFAVLPSTGEAAPAAPPASPPLPAKTPKTAQNKPPAKPAQQQQQQQAQQPKPSPKNATTGKTTRTTENAVRRQISGGPTYDDAAAGADTPELRALAAAERELFPPASPNVGAPWPQELPLPVAMDPDRPRVHASGLPPAPPHTSPPTNEAGKDLSWLSKLDMPDLPVRWEYRVVRYLEFFKDDPRGRATITTWLKRSGRYRDGMRKVMRKKGLPEDLTALAMIESGFDPTARSPVGAMGLWQFMPDTGKIYGLTVDRWADQRMSINVATEAAADHLADLHRRFGSWDLAMAAYNMGYGGVLQAVRRYNTNDYWALAKLEGSLPWETSLYVPKILAAAVVMKNLAAFNLADVTIEPALDGEDVPVAPGTALATVATACGTTTKDLELLNPELRASRTPPTQEDWPVKVPAGKASGCASNLARARKDQPVTERYVVRFGESLEQIAQSRKVTVAKIVELNAIGPGEVVRGGTVLLLPKSDGTTPPPPGDPKKAAEKPVVIVPQELFVYPDRRRVFYRVQVGDTVKDVCTAFKVTPDEVRRWNDIDTAARLVEGMTVQLFVPREADLSHAVIVDEKDVRVIVTGSEEFFQHWDDKGRKRIVVTAKAGETIEQIGKRHGVSANLMARINRRNPGEVLPEGERVVVWVPGPSAPSPASANQQATLARPIAPEPTQTPPLAAPPVPDALPQLP